MVRYILRLFLWPFQVLGCSHQWVAFSWTFAPPKLAKMQPLLSQSALHICIPWWTDSRSLMSLSGWVQKALEHLNQLKHLINTRIQRKSTLSKGSPSSSLKQRTLIVSVTRTKGFLIHLKLKGGRRVPKYYTTAQRHTVSQSHWQCTCC